MNPKDKAFLNQIYQKYYGKQTDISEREHEERVLKFDERRGAAREGEELS